MTTLRTLGVVAMLLAIPLAAGAQPTLTGAIAFQTDSAGNTGGQNWNTLGGDGSWNLYVIQGAPGGAFVNSGDSASTSISIPLSVGANTFTFEGDYAGSIPYEGLNLFFDGANSLPRISVFETIGVTGGRPDAGNTRQLDGNGVAGAGTLVFYADGYRVSVSNYLARLNVSGTDRVSAHADSADGTNDNLITLTITVEAAPAIPALGGAGLLGLALLIACASVVVLRRFA